ncbi:hypothetical protein BDW68DRAFT_153870 [Aspergillus falconensis]
MAPPVQVMFPEYPMAAEAILSPWDLNACAFGAPYPSLPGGREWSCCLDLISD